MTGYVAGLLFDPDYERVALIRKNRPDWQAGRLNAIGGHIEPGETSWVAMFREFYEEAGVAIGNWEYFAKVSGPWGFVDFYRSSSSLIDHLRTVTDEPIEIWQVQDVLKMDSNQRLPNLSWLIPLAAYNHDAYLPIIAMENNG